MGLNLILVKWNNVLTGICTLLSKYQSRGVIMVNRKVRVAVRYVIEIRLLLILHKISTGIRTFLRKKHFYEVFELLYYG